MQPKNINWSAKFISGAYDRAHQTFSRNPHLPKMIDLVAEYFTGDLYNEVHARACRAMDDGEAESITDAYKRMASNFVNAICSDKANYEKVVGRIHALYREKIHPGGNLAEFVDFITRPLIPLDYFETCNFSNKASLMGSFISTFLRHAINIYLSPAYLELVIDHHNDQMSIDGWYYITRDIMFMVREEMYTGITKAPVNHVSAETTDEDVVPLSIAEKIKEDKDRLLEQTKVAIAKHMKLSQICEQHVITIKKLVAEVKRQQEINRELNHTIQELRQENENARDEIVSHQARLLTMERATNSPARGTNREHISDNDTPLSHRETPRETPTLSHRETPRETPTLSHRETPTTQHRESPRETPTVQHRESPTLSHRETPTTQHRESPRESPRETPERKPPMQVDVQTSWEMDQESAQSDEWEPDDVSNMFDNDVIDDILPQIEKNTPTEVLIESTPYIKSSRGSRIRKP